MKWETVRKRWEGLHAKLRALDEVIYSEERAFLRKRYVHSEEARAKARLERAEIEREMTELLCNPYGFGLNIISLADYIRKVMSYE